MLRVDARALQHQARDGDQHHHQHRDFVAEAVLEIVDHFFGRRRTQQRGTAKRASCTFREHAENQQQEESVHRGFVNQVKIAVVETRRDTELAEHDLNRRNRSEARIVDEHDDGADEEPDKRDIERVVHPSPGLADDDALPERIAQREDEAARKLVEAALLGLPQRHDAKPSPQRVDDRRGPQRRQRIHDHDERVGHVPQDGAGNLLVHRSSGLSRSYRYGRTTRAHRFNRPLTRPRVGFSTGQAAVLRVCNRLMLVGTFVIQNGNLP